MLLTALSLVGVDGLVAKYNTDKYLNGELSGESVSDVLDGSSISTFESHLKIAESDTRLKYDALTSIGSWGFVCSNGKVELDGDNNDLLLNIDTRKALKAANEHIDTVREAIEDYGAKFDENGNAANWWSEQDYAAFQAKCMEVANWYEGQEACPGVSCSGILTISENVADLGAMQCILAAAKEEKSPNLDKLFKAVANTWASTTTRQMREYLATMDVHAPDKLRCNRVLQTAAEFYETYHITEGDGMWTEPASRVSVW